MFYQRFEIIFGDIYCAECGGHIHLHPKQVKNYIQ